MPVRALSLLLALLASAAPLAHADDQAERGVSPARKAFDSITSAELFAHVKWLADDKRRGRDSGTAGERAAGDYIARHFEKAGLKPGGVDGTWFQPFPLGSTVGMGKNNVLRVGDDTYRVEQDYAPFGFSGNGKAESALVFAGYGITAPEHDYDDYKGLDVKGKVVLILRHEPRVNVAGKEFAGRRHTRHAHFQTKVALAVKHGAAALLIVSNPRITGDDDPLFGWRGGGSEGGRKIPVIHVKIAVVEKWFAAMGKTLRGHQKKIDDALEPASFVSELKITAGADLQVKKRTARNVLGFLEGSDPELKKEIVVVGGHYDHVGLGFFGSRLGNRARGQIHNGADDNASGTSGVLEVAQAFSAGGLKPRRSILFIAFSGEERGLIGSRFYCDNPTYPLERTVTMLNMDMIGRNTTGQFQVNGVGTAEIFPKLCEKVNQALGTKATFGQSGYAPSDNTSFYVKKIPVLFFFSGLHADYHAPTDVPEKINKEQMQHIARYCFTVLHYLTTILDERPKVIWKARGGGRRQGVRLGIGVDDIRATNGIKVRSVAQGSPAFSAGMQVGDVIVKFGDNKITDMRSLGAALRQHKAGDVVTVVVKRGDGQATLKVTLASR